MTVIPQRVHDIAQLGFFSRGLRYTSVIQYLSWLHMFDWYAALLKAKASERATNVRPKANGHAKHDEDK